MDSDLYLCVRGEIAPILLIRKPFTGLGRKFHVAQSAFDANIYQLSTLEQESPLGSSL